MPAVLAIRPAATRMSLPSIFGSPAAVRTTRLTFSPYRPRTWQKFGADVNLNAFANQNTAHLLRDVADLPT